MAIPVLSVEEGAAALVAPLKSLQQPRRGWSGEKGDPIVRGTSIAALAGPWPPLLPDLQLAIPTRPRGEGAKERYDAPAPARAALAIQVSNVAGDIVTTKGDAISGH